MNELAAINNKIAEVDRRTAELKTPAGIAKANGEITKMIAVLDSAGYKAPNGGERMIRVWEKVLAEYVALYGYEIIAQAAWEFITTDSREVKTFPKPADIIQAIRAVGGISPRVVKARLEAEELEKKIVDDWKKELRDKGAKE